VYEDDTCKWVGQVRAVGLWIVTLNRAHIISCLITNTRLAGVRYEDDTCKWLGQFCWFIELSDWTVIVLFTQKPTTGSLVSEYWDHVLQCLWTWDKNFTFTCKWIQFFFLAYENIM
jgi:hypothetical protein